MSGRNSGVLHSGIYYKPGSLKALNCRTGKEAMERFCEAENIPFDRCGKVIVATRQEELPQLERIYERGQAGRATYLASALGAQQFDVDVRREGNGGQADGRAAQQEQHDRQPDQAPPRRESAAQQRTTKATALELPVIRNPINDTQINLVA